MKIRPNSRRRGMTTVETALVLSVFCILLFGVFEYSRFLYMLHVANNAARDGARYAVVNVDKPSNFDTTDYTDGAGTTFQNIQGYTKDRMGGGYKQLDGYASAVYAVDPAGLALSPPVVRPKSLSTTVFPDPFNASDPNKVAWNVASFTEGIAVTIKGNYTPILPGFLFMPSSVPMYITAMAGSEG